MPIFMIIPSVIMLFLMSLIAGTINYLSKDSDSIWSFDRPTRLDKVWFVTNLVLLSWFF
jgi:hypothetical protein